MLKLLHSLAREKKIRLVDYHFARFISRSDDNPLVLVLACWLSKRLSSGHVCLNPNALATAHWLDLDGEDDWLLRHNVDNHDWQASLAQSPVVGDNRPFVLAHDKLYMTRYWRYERQVADALIERADVRNALPAAEMLSLFFPDSEAGVDWQRIAVMTAASRGFAIISGGPGTGKTYTVTNLLGLLLSQCIGDAKQPLIRLAAPTGKAAARLTESIRNNVMKLNFAPDIRARIPTEAVTLHRLLGALAGGRHFRHNRDNPLHLDVLVVDEASMVDLPMMAKLLQALPAHARLILLGDKDQLASVEAGCVLTDLCRMAGSDMSRHYGEQVAAVTGEDIGSFVTDEVRPLQDNVCLLRKSHRFDQGSGIGQWATLVNRETSMEKRDLDNLLDQSLTDVHFMAIHEVDSPWKIIAAAAENYRPYRDILRRRKWRDAVASEQGVRDIFQVFNRFRVLSARRRGIFGVERINAGITRQLFGRKNFLWYHGRPVMITRNDYEQGLYNGDVGIALGFGRQIRVYFEMADGRLRYFSPNRLPEHETAFALTVHKSQGSEFDKVFLVISGNVKEDEPLRDEPLLNRMLVYTGITRARSELLIVSEKSILLEAVNRDSQRFSGLAEQFFDPGSDRSRNDLLSGYG